MNIIYLLIPIALLLVSLVIAAFLWAVKSDQFEDLEGPAHRILFDDDEPPSRAAGDSTEQPSGQPPEQHPEQQPEQQPGKPGDPHA